MTSSRETHIQVMVLVATNYGDPYNIFKRIQFRMLISYSSISMLVVY